MPIETMLRDYFLQNWYALSDSMTEETLYDSVAMRCFAGIELGDDRIPDETTILNFRHLLERHGLTEAIFADVNGHLADKGIALRSGTPVDATIIDAPSSPKNKAGARDPETSSTKKSNDWYFGSEENRQTPMSGLMWTAAPFRARKQRQRRCMTAACGTTCSTATRPRSGPTRAMSALSARPRSTMMAKSGA